MRGLLRTRSADTIGKGNLNFALSTHFQKKDDQLLSPGGFFPLGDTLLSDGGTATVDYLWFITRPALTYGLNDHFEISVSLDVRNWVRLIQDEGQHSDLDTQLRGGLGDTEVSAKVGGIPLGTDHIMVGALSAFRFATGNKERRFTTESTDFTVMGLATLDFTDLDSFVPTRLHVNAGLRWNRNENMGAGIFSPDFPDSTGFGPPAYPATPSTENANFNDQFLFAAAIEFPAPKATFFVEFSWEKFNNIDVDDPMFALAIPSDATRFSPSTLILSPGIEFTSDTGGALKLGGDLNLNKGDEPSLTNPADWGLWIMFSHTAEIVPKDTDGDGIKDADDACPDQAEDLDGYEDQDGCPDLDNDGDGIPDAEDNCPDLPEDFDGYEDGDGCPDLDNDQDGIPDVDDRCPDEPEDFDGDADADGCPDLVKDSDNDGIPDDVDRCPLQAEDIDGFQDDDGCPDLDNDLDGIPDDVDNCPNTPETFNGYEDEDGCPDEKPIEAKFILKGVNFESSSASLTPDSYPVLEQVARSLQAYPEVRVEIRGHTDSQGAASYNLNLSQRRADSVKQYLVNYGIDPSRVVTTGVGEEEPISSNSTAEGRAENRRIEFRRLN